MPDSITPPRAEVTNEDVRPLHLSKGCFYRDANGDKVGPVYRYSGDTWHALGSAGVWNGAGKLTGIYGGSDLVAEWRADALKAKRETLLGTRDGSGDGPCASAIFGRRDGDVAPHSWLHSLIELAVEYIEPEDHGDDFDAEAFQTMLHECRSLELALKAHGPATPKQVEGGPTVGLQPVSAERLEGLRTDALMILQHVPRRADDRRACSLTPKELLALIDHPASDEVWRLREALAYAEQMSDTDQQMRRSLLEENEHLRKRLAALQEPQS